MYFKIRLPVILFFMISVSGCSQLNKLIYKPNINQGNYLSDNEVSKIHKGMSQKEVIAILGSPMLDDPFGTNTWFYIFRQQTGHKNATQQSLILKFDKSAQLIDIKNEPT